MKNKINISLKTIRQFALVLIIPYFSFAQIISQSIIDSQDEPIKYIGNKMPDIHFYDGKLPHAIGVHHYQVYRANRSLPINGDEFGWTYNHQPFLAYWQGHFYVQYLSNPFQEHDPPGRTLIVTSKDGRYWDNPTVVFPEYTLPEINYKGLHVEAGMRSVMHQRMGFYLSPNGKLLTSAFYGYSPTPRNSPNAGNGLGRVIREIKSDGTFGPIYFIRYNRHAGWNESNTNYPYYTTSKDKDFLAACESLLSDKLVTLQWWEEDRADDGFYNINPGDVPGSAAFSATISTSKGSGKAFDYFHRPDGVVVGLWKNQYSALSPDNGKTWTKISKNRTLLTDGAKTWGQKTDDGKYVVIHNQSVTFRNRYPMTSVTSKDGHLFNDLLSLRNDNPPVRYQALHKNPGSQYYRGIIEGNGNPHGDDIWIVYSLNKEDIWIAKISTPLTGIEKEEINQNFENIVDVMQLNKWNIYKPTWVSINIVNDPYNYANKVLELKDEEPIDFARVERVFPERKKFTINFRINPMEIPIGYAMDIEVQDKHGVRPMKIRLDKDWISFDHRYAKFPNPVKIELKKWYAFSLTFDCENQTYSLKINGKVISNKITFAYEVNELQRIVFRTGPYRGEVTPKVLNIANIDTPGLNVEDIPGTEQKVKASIFLIDDVKTKRNKI
tara:strand:+ start:37535 stop:39529 length:1995 start_codon:yes stop_codon:yes gene_type:complete